TVMSWISEATLRSLVRLGERARRQYAGEMPLEFFAGVDAAARIDGALNQFGCFIDLRRADRPADERGASVLGQDRFVAGVAKADPRFGASSIVVDAHRAGHADEG